MKKLAENSVSAVSERKRAERERKARAGLVRLELWVPKEKRDELRETFSAIIAHTVTGRGKKPGK